MDYKANIDIQADFTDGIASEAVASRTSATAVLYFQGAFGSPSAPLRLRSGTALRHRAQGLQNQLVL